MLDYQDLKQQTELEILEGHNPYRAKYKAFTYMTSRKVRNSNRGLFIHLQLDLCYEDQAIYTIDPCIDLMAHQIFDDCTKDEQKTLYYWFWCGLTPQEVAAFSDVGYSGIRKKRYLLKKKLQLRFGGNK